MKNTILVLLALVTAMVGHTLHHSLFWSLADFFFWPLAWAKWLVFHEVNRSVLRATFSFLLA